MANDKINPMSDKELAKILENDREWRKQLYKEVSEMRQEFHQFRLDMAITTTTLKVKIGIFGALFGFLGSLVVPAIAMIAKSWA